ncbi:hypothetical protein HIM_12038 [Hirsutella minnesotensis 3608]|uniref:MULE transposase domain-containing protein n=1 Tax=Hirsutella minnesotensis 3608 TaxID=1043627 RepID=A0A0F8A0I3_9HYPO|nr:hypothetical protein HIM_12038 [Hirsutella minnesotensis 3608]
MSSDAGITARKILLALKAADPAIIATEQDIANINSRRQVRELGQHTATQALVARLDEEGTFHRERLDHENRFLYQIVGLDHGCELWQHHSHLIMLDVTYSTNRYSLKLLQINSFTSLGTIFPLAFCLIPIETAEAFTWCFYRLREWLAGQARSRGQADDAFIPFVIVTDYDAAVREALSLAFPEAQLQLCVWHIFKNIVKHANRRWKGDGADQRASIAREAFEAEVSDNPDASKPASPAGFCQEFKRIIYTRTEEEFTNRWEAFQSAYPTQRELLDYIDDVYMPMRRQWAGPWTRLYRNFGHTTTSPCESLHAITRTFLPNSQANLLGLYEALCLQRRASSDHHESAVTRESRRTLEAFRGPLYAAAVEKVSHKGLELVAGQARAAAGALLHLDEQ